MPMKTIPVALARSGMYRLLSLAFDYPTPDLAIGLKEVQGALQANAPGALSLQTDLPALDPNLDGEYLRLFDRKVTCSPYESEHGMGNKSFTKSRDLADLAGYYAAFGVDLDGIAGELYDHIKVELEFMSLLCIKEGYAQSEGLIESGDVTQEAQRSFLREHLGRWVPTFCDKLLDATNEPFYLRLAQITKDWVADELARLDVEPIPLVRIPVGAATNDDMDADCLICPMAGDAQP